MTTLDLFADHPKPDYAFVKDWLEPKLASDMQRDILKEVRWKQDSMRVPGGSQVPLPRRTCWQGEADALYVYSGIRNEPDAWSPTVLELKQRLEEELGAGARFNSVLLNHYRDGRDSIGWHADDEPELGPEPIIASVSLGATRTFEFRHKRLAGVEYALPLCHGSLLIMRGATQRDWKHRVDKEPRIPGDRINLTFRWIHAAR